MQIVHFAVCDPLHTIDIAFKCNPTLSRWNCIYDKLLRKGYFHRISVNWEFFTNLKSFQSCPSFSNCGKAWEVHIFDLVIFVRTKDFCSHLSLTLFSRYCLFCGSLGVRTLTQCCVCSIVHRYILTAINNNY